MCKFQKQNAKNIHTFMLFNTSLKASLLVVILNLSKNSIIVPNFSLLKLYFWRKVSAFRRSVENIPVKKMSVDEIQCILIFPALTIVSLTSQQKIE